MCAPQTLAPCLHGRLPAGASVPQPLNPCPPSTHVPPRPVCSAISKMVGPKLAPAVVTLSFIALWYALNVYFNLLNKSIFKYFPFPYTVSTVHVVVGTVYCALVYVLGLKNWSFGRVSACGPGHMCAGACGVGMWAEARGPGHVGWHMRRGHVG